MGYVALRRSVLSGTVLALLVTMGVVSGSPARAWASGNQPPQRTLVGGETGLNCPSSVAFDGDGLMYVTNSFSDTITVYAKDWISGNSSPVKTLGGPATGLDAPTSVAFDSAGQMYVVNSDANSVTVYTQDWMSGDTAPRATLVGASTGLSGPRTVAFDSANRMYVSNRTGYTVTAYPADWAEGEGTSNRNVAPLKTLTGLTEPWGLALDSGGRLYVANYQGKDISVFSANWISASGDTTSAVVQMVASLSGEATGFGAPTAVAIDAFGRTVVVGQHLGDSGPSVTAYTPTWESDNTPPVKTLQGMQTGMAGSSGVAFDGVGRLYVANCTGYSVTAYAADRAPKVPTNVTAVAGNGRVTVSWEPPSSIYGSSIASYVATARPGGATCSWSSGPLTCSIVGLRNGTDYTVIVSVLTADGRRSTSTASAKVRPRTVPTAPRAVTAIAGERRATVSWEAPRSDGGSSVSAYIVTAMPGGKTCRWTSGPLRCVVRDLGTKAYSFTVVARNAAGLGAVSSPSTSVRPT